VQKGESMTRTCSNCNTTLAHSTSSQGTMYLRILEIEKHDASPLLTSAGLWVPLNRKKVGKDYQRALKSFKRHARFPKLVTSSCRLGGKVKRRRRRKYPFPQVQAKASTAWKFRFGGGSDHGPAWGVKIREKSRDTPSQGGWGVGRKKVGSEERQKATRWKLITKRPPARRRACERNESSKLRKNSKETSARASDR